MTPNSTRKLCCKMKQDVSRQVLLSVSIPWFLKDTVIFGLSHRDWLPHKCLSSLSRSKCQLFSTSARITTKATRHIRCFQVGILGCTFSELQFIRMAVGRAATGAEGHNNRLHQQQQGRGAIDNYSNGEDDQWSQWGRVWVVPSFVYIEYNILSLSNITNYALFRS